MTTIKAGKIEALWRYPLSSVCGERVEQLELTSSGPVGDRLFGLFDDETHEIVFPSRHKHWNLAPMISAKLDRTDALLMSLDGTSWYNSKDPTLQKGLAELFGRPVSVVTYGTEVGRKSAVPRYKHSPVHLLSRQSIEALKKLLPSSIIDERRFRPNIVVDFKTENFKEPPEYGLLGKEFQIGDVWLRGTRECGRCSFTTLEQVGIPEDRAVLRALISNFEKNFGIYCEIIGPGLINTGADISMDPLNELDSAVVVVGAGQAGGTAARSLRDLGHRGPITVLGEERHTPYERPPLSKPFKGSGATYSLTDVLSGPQAEELGIDIHLDETVVHIDRDGKTVETAHGAKHRYDRLILATGGSPRRVPRLSRGYGRIHSVRTANDAAALHASFQTAKRIFVLGGGWLGLEIAAMARAASIEVDLFDREPYLCSRALPKVVGEFLSEVHTKQGVKLHMKSAPSFVEQPYGVDASFEGRSERADLLVAAIGIHPNDHLARLAGLDCRDGIITNENGATIDPSIYAIGDVSRQQGSNDPIGVRIESWQNANEQAQRAARAILGLESHRLSVPRFWSDQYDLTIQIAGMPNPLAVPEAVDGTEYPLWRFKNFVVGINRPREVHRFAMSASATLVESQAADEFVAEQATTRQLLGHENLLADDELKRISIDALGDVTLVRHGDDYFAIQDRCPHADASLSEGFIEGHRIVCPLHFAEFDLATGAVFNAPKGCPRARTYKVEAQDNFLYIHVPIDNQG